jgi:spoIIIJ-associated protein
MDYSEKWGTDIEEAVKLALIDLKLSRDEVEVIVLEQPSKGFFGIGSKLAKVRVVPKKEEEVIPEPQPEPVVEEVQEEAPAEKKQEQKKNETRKKRDKKRKEKRTPIIPKEPEENLVALEEHAALDFLKDITEKMGLQLNITAKAGEESLYVDINGKDSGTVIGKRGQTLDAIQYLTSLVVNKDEDKYTRVVVDAENYREKRERTLEQLANRLADKVVRTGKNVRLEPMNPYERKVIHATLQSNPNVTTKSEGEEPYRRVRIELSK